MFDSLNQFILKLMDGLLGWTLTIPREWVLLGMALFTAFVMVLIRRFTSNQKLLHRCAADKSKLKELIRDAKSRGDKEAVARIRTTRNQVSQKAMGQEWKPLLFSILPMILITTWMWQRVAFVPAKADEPCVLRAEFPVTSAGRFAHLVPSDGVKAEGGLIKTIEAGKSADAETSTAEWTVIGKPGIHQLTVRYEGLSYEHPLILDGAHYADQTREHDQRVNKTEILLKPTKLFGVVPGIPSKNVFGYFSTPEIDPWMVGYLIVAILAVPLFKRVMRVA